MKKAIANSSSEPSQSENKQDKYQFELKSYQQSNQEFLKVIIEEENFFGDYKQIYKVNQITLEEVNYDEKTQQVQLLLLFQKLQNLGIDISDYQTFYKVKKSYFNFCGIAPHFQERYIQSLEGNEVYLKIRQTFQQIQKNKQALAENEGSQEQYDESSFGRKISKVQTLLESKFPIGLMINSTRHNQKSVTQPDQDKNKVVKNKKQKKMKIGQLLVLVSK